MLIPKINFRKLQSIYKKKSDKSGQGSLVAVILASVIGTIIISSTTQWFLSMNKTMDGTNDRLEAMTIAMSEWQRLEHMSLDELEANRENYKTPYKVGDNFTVGVNLGKQGFFDNGTCNALTGDYASESPNCFKDTTMTVYDKDGKAMYTTRSLPLSSQGSSTDLPVGTILPYVGDISDIPKGWALCNGSNGTPDLRNRFLEGTTTKANMFVDAGLPSLTSDTDFYAPIGGDFMGYTFGKQIDDSKGFDGANFDGKFPTGDADAALYARTSGGGSYLYLWMNKFSKLLTNTGLYGVSNTVQPASYTVYYIMRIK